MAERTVGIKVFRYHEEVPSVTEPGKTVLKQRFARRGETVDFREEDIAVGEAHDAFLTKEQLEAKEQVEGAAEEAGVPDLSDKDVTELVEYLEENSPTAPQTISLANDDPELAEKLIEAENMVTGRDPRSTVIEGLEKVIEDAEDEEDEDED